MMAVVNRRRFLVYTTASSLLPLLPGCRRGRPRPDASAAVVAGVLSEPELRLLAAICARIMPSDRDPGATEAGVAAYIDQQLRHEPVRRFHRMLLTGMRQLEMICRRHHRRAFVDLAAERQDEMLRRLQRNKRLGGRFNGERFMRTLIGLTLEGFFGDPIYGGNRDRVGWRMIGFVPQQPGPRRPYRNRKVGLG
jgi:hypothetical protein